MDRRAFLGVVAATALAARGVEPPLRQLKRLVDGDVVAAGDAHYASARQLWDARFDVLRPRAIVYCASATDVARTLDWARMHQIRAVPRSGGHSYAGYSSGNGVVIVDVSRLNRVSVVSGHATVGAGAKLIDVYAALAAGGKTIPAGSCPTVGIAGLALGGGIGYASRAFGLTSDNLQRVHIVTADGELRACDVRNEPDLFWACRGGGGGNFGIVTSLDIAKHPTSTVSTYSIEWPWEQAAQAVAAWQAFAPHAPDELFSVLDLIATGPTAPGARAHVVSAGQYFGTETALAALIQPLASTGAPISVKTASVWYLETPSCTGPAANRRVHRAAGLERRRLRAVIAALSRASLHCEARSSVPRGATSIPWALLDFPFRIGDVCALYPAQVRKRLTKDGPLRWCRKTIGSVRPQAESEPSDAAAAYTTHIVTGGGTMDLRSASRRRAGSRRPVRADIHAVRVRRADGD